MLLDERPVGVLERGKVGRIDSLSNAIKARRHDPQAEPPGPLYQLTVADEVDGAQLKSAFQTAAFSGWTFASLDVGGNSITLHARVPQPPSDPGTIADLAWPAETLVLVVRRDSVELWRAKSTPRPAPPTENVQKAPAEPVTPPPDEPAQSIGSITAENIATGLPSLLRTVCDQGHPCNPAVLYVADDVPFSLLRGALQALTTISTGDSRPIVQLRLSDPERPDTPLRVRVGTTAVSGRLPPSVIQKITRENFSRLRECYVAGLGRDPELTGRVVTRFVIGRDGHVSNAIATDGTTMPDQRVTECVVAQFRGFQFPEPEGGIVTVVYPIMFAPGE